MTEEAAGSAPGQASAIAPLDIAGSGVLPPVEPRVRQAFRWLERLAPWVGSRWAVELWCTPPVLESALRMPPGVGPGEPVDAYWGNRHRVVGEQWGEGPPVYLVHGWGGQRAHLAVFVKPLVERGFRAIAFDLPSHNASEPGELAPGRTTATECADAIAAMIRTHGAAHAVVAHSLGANATTLAAAGGASVGRLVLLAPMGDFPLYLDLFAARHDFGRRIRAGLHRRLEKRIGMRLEETNMSRLGRRANYPPLLLIHDPDDPDSPYAATARLSTLWPGAQLMSTRGLGRLAHYRILRHRPAINAGMEMVGSPG
ncbi:alpha/beta fold hydrolase [Mycobacterium sp. PSTR-4-N]|uniref:alpha/beta fold hydrolase n=1 Tax=Mycobacterium sp. PSTR-4-N TaxID=2917745 RepID=UPI001F155028|nr:alpha/beta fold hydrolase [Mycobacterium sp. PSTR-4-N]MCG7597606.1 alpha/beta fold hydrolase [Mycobacterium sp. PSTR-4-N]